MRPGASRPLVLGPRIKGSRPSRVALWEYLFFVDIEGHRDDPQVAEALADVGRIAGYIKVLGSYPVAVL